MLSSEALKDTKQSPRASDIWWPIFFGLGLGRTIGFG